MSTSLIDALRTVPIFSDLSAEQLEWLVSHGSDEVHDDGAMLFLPGSEADSMTAILEGSIDVLLSIGGQMVPFLTQRAGTVTRRTRRGACSPRGPRPGAKAGAWRPTVGPWSSRCTSTRLRKRSRSGRRREPTNLLLNHSNAVYPY